MDEPIEYQSCDEVIRNFASDLHERTSIQGGCEPLGQ